MANLQEVTYREAGLTKSDIYSLVFTEMAKNSDGLEIKDINKIVNTELAKNSQILSKQGERTLSNLISVGAVSDGFIHPFDKENPKWRLTSEGRQLIEQLGQQEESVFNTETETDEKETPNTVKGFLLEKYVLGLLKEMYPYYSWFHQGVQKNNERGLDLIANKIGEQHSEHKTIGVQVKNHKETSAPTKEEWLKFLAGCFVRHIEEAMFITTGKLTSEQRREAGEAKITVIESIDELNRIAKLYKYKTYDEYNGED
jgi:predicted transcriptional regulator